MKKTYSTFLSYEHEASFNVVLFYSSGDEHGTSRVNFPADPHIHWALSQNKKGKKKKKKRTSSKPTTSSNSPIPLPHRLLFIARNGCLSDWLYILSRDKSFTSDSVPFRFLISATKKVL